MFNDDQVVASELMPRRGTQRKEQKRSIDSRKAILRAALTEFAARGYEGATLRGIGKQANIEFTLIRYHFKNKEILWKAVVEYYISSAPFFDPEYRQQQVHNSAFERLKSDFKNYLHFSSRYPEFDRFMLQCKVETDERQRWMIDKVLNPLRNHFVELIKKSQDEGKVNQGPADLMYYLLIGATSNLSNMAPEMALTYGEGFSYDELVEDYWNLLEKTIFLTS